MSAQGTHYTANQDKTNSQAPHDSAAQLFQEKTAGDGENNACDGKDGHHESRHGAADLETIDEKGHNGRYLVIIQGPRKACKKRNGQNRPRRIPLTIYIK
jgi:hypothetical protein